MVKLLYLLLQIHTQLNGYADQLSKDLQAITMLTPSGETNLILKILALSQ